jgi:hypothetical protein
MPLDALFFRHARYRPRHTALAFEEERLPRDIEEVVARHDAVVLRELRETYARHGGGS